MEYEVEVTVFVDVLYVPSPVRFESPVWTELDGQRNAVSVSMLAVPSQIEDIRRPPSRFPDCLLQFLTKTATKLKLSSAIRS